MKAVVAAFNQEKALVGAFSVITNLRMELFETLVQAALAQLVPAVSRALVPGAGDSLARLLHSLASSVHTQVERVSSYIFGRDQLRSSRYLYLKQ